MTGSVILTSLTKWSIALDITKSRVCPLACVFSLTCCTRLKESSKSTNCLAVVSLELSTWILKSPTINSRLCRWSAVIDSKSLENSSKNNDVDKPGSRSTSRIFIQRTMPRWKSKRVILIRERGVYANAALKYNSNSTTSRMRSWYMHHSISFRTYCTNFHRVDSTRTKPCLGHLFVF